MIKNTVGNILIPKLEANGHVSVRVYESEAIMDAHLLAPLPETAPDNLSIYLDKKMEDAMTSVTSLDGLTLAEKMQDLLEEVIVVSLTENFKLLAKTKFEISTFTKI